MVLDTGALENGGTSEQFSRRKTTISTDLVGRESWSTPARLSPAPLELGESDSPAWRPRLLGRARQDGALDRGGYGAADQAVELLVVRSLRPVLPHHEHLAWPQIESALEELAYEAPSEDRRLAIYIEGVISGIGDAAQEVVGNSANGFPSRMSIGTKISRLQQVAAGETVEVNGRTFSGPLEAARQTELHEVSFVAIGADDKTSAKVAAGK